MEHLINAIAVSNNEQKVLLLPQFLEYGESGINYLIKCLEDSELEIRAKAYGILQDVESEKVSKAIAPGLLFNPGDCIYSVYQSGMGFDDQEYYLVEDYIDYAHQIHKLIDIDCFCDPRGLGIRKYCHVDKVQAESTTEALHRQLIKNKRYDSEWRKENPNFNPKQWCTENQIIYQDEWDEELIYSSNYLHVAWEIKEIIRGNEELTDNLRRSRYIYHPKHMDVWCKDNNIDYQKICSKQNNIKPWEEHWSDYIQVLDYLNMSKNIEILSKFWKDGVGNYAFLREEIVQQVTYVKIGKELNSKLGADKIFAVSKEFEIEARELVINAIEGNKSQIIAKARELIRESDWYEIPF